MSNISKQERISKLYDYFLSKTEHRLKKKDVDKFYKKLGIELSDKIIYDDMNSIATCNKKNNYFTLNDTLALKNSSKNLEQLLNKFTLYQPTQLTFSIQHEKLPQNDLNPQYLLFSIHLKLNDNLPIYYLEQFKYFVTLYFKRRKKNITDYVCDIVISNRMIQFNSNNLDKIIELYNEFYNLKLNNYK
ncbi:MAG: hypothetical protein ACLRVZ_08440 [Turicibacter sp.]